MLRHTSAISETSRFAGLGSSIITLLSKSLLDVKLIKVPVILKMLIHL